MFFSKKSIFKLFILVILLILVGCNSSYELSYAVEKNSLEVILSGRVISEERNIEKIIIDWGDNSGSMIVYDNFDDIIVKHRYRKEGTYTITMVIYDETENELSAGLDITVLRGDDGAKAGVKTLGKL